MLLNMNRFHYKHIQNEHGTHTIANGDRILVIGKPAKQEVGSLLEMRPIFKGYTNISVFKKCAH